MTGEPVCKLLMGRLREEDLPVNMGFSLHPTTSGLFAGDYGIVFDFQPVAPTTTRVRCQWLVAGGAEEGRDYDVATLIELWMSRIARTGRSARSPSKASSPAASFRGRTARSANPASRGSGRDTSR